jgi:curved DNA-binding protein CbpA
LTEYRARALALHPDKVPVDVVGGRQDEALKEFLLLKV